MTEPAFSLDSPLTGVSGAAVEAVEAGGVRCFFSLVADENSSTRPQDAALSFHRVLQEIFARTAILPFRFPTILEGEPELISHIQEHAAEYRSALARLRDLVQMEIRISSDGLKQSKKKEEEKASGTEYLLNRLAERRKLESAAENVRNDAASLLRGWRQRESGAGLRCFMLLRRGEIAQLRSALSRVQISPDLAVRVSGPWPATEFVKEA